MPRLGDEIQLSTGLNEQEAKAKLQKPLLAHPTCKAKRVDYNETGLGDTYPDDSWGFITWVLGADAKEFAKLIKGGIRRNNARS